MNKELIIKKAIDKDKLIKHLDENRGEMIHTHSFNKPFDFGDRSYTINLFSEIANDKREIVQVASKSPIAFMYSIKITDFLEHGGYEKEALNMIEEDEFKKDKEKVDYNLAKDTLKILPKTESRANLALYISIFIVIFEIAKFLFSIYQKQSKI